jgi:hypothetical protein
MLVDPEAIAGSGAFRRLILLDSATMTSGCAAKGKRLE